MPFTRAYNSGYNHRGTAIRMSYKSPAYGLPNDQFSLGLQNRRRTGDGVLMLDGQYDVNLEHSSVMGLNVGLGQRWLYQGSFGKTARIFGATFWYDGANTELRNMLNQVGVSLESLGETWDFRLNTNLPVGTTRQDGNGVPTGEISYFGYYLSALTSIPIDQAISVVDFEVARRIGHDNIWAWAGGYSLWEKDTDDSAFGGKAGVRGYVYDDLLLQLAVTSDEMFDTKVTFSMIWYPGRSSRRHRTRHSIDDRLMEPVIRNNYIALRRDHKDGGNPLEYEDTGEEIRVVHVDSNATGTGDGSFESPFTSLDSVFGGSQKDDIVLVHSNTAYSGQHVALLDNQRLLGEGNDIKHYVTAKDFGITVLPATSTGALAGVIPQISNTTGDVVTLGSAETSREHDDDSTTSTNEVNNLAIDGGYRGIVSSTVGIGQATIKNMTIANTTRDLATDPNATGNGIELTPFTETIVQEGGSTTKQVLFSPTIDTVALTNIGGDGINLDATTTEPDSTPVTESINLRNITSTDGTGQGIHVTNNKNFATIDAFTGNSGSVAASGGILFTNSKGGADITNSTIEGGAGKGISIAGDSTGNFSIIDTNITDTGSAAFHIDGGSSSVNFVGLISQGEDAAAVKVEGDHTGTVNFYEASEDAGVIAAIAGDGLVFGDAVNGGADGIYNFNNGVKLTGVSTGIDIQNSAGTVTLNDALVEDATIAAVRINGDSANLDFTGQIVQTTATAGTAVDISDGHTGVVTFTEGETDSSQNGNGVIVVTYGSGLQFDDADGIYTFNDAVSLTGTGTNMTAGVNISNDSAGLFTFSDTTITDITGIAFNLNGGTATVNFTGLISQTAAGAGAAVNIAGDHHTGTVNFNEATTGAGVIEASIGDGLVFGDATTGANGTYNFNHAVALSGTTGIDIESSDGTITFSDATVENSSITALNISGGAADVNFTGLITKTSGTAAAVNVDGNHTGTVSLTEATADAGVVVASIGTGLTFTGADGTYNFNDAVTLSGGAVVDIDGSDGSFTFDGDSSINYSGTGTAFTINNGEATVTYSGDITSTGSSRPVEITDNSGGLVMFTGTIDGDANGILVDDNDGGSFQFSGLVDLDTTTNNAVDFTNNDNATVAFSNLNATTTTGIGFNAVGDGTEDGGYVQLTGSNNTIETTGTGTVANLEATGIYMKDVQIAPAGAAFASVSVGSGGAGPGSGIVLEDVTGGLLSVNGGTIENTVGVGVSITNVANVSLNNMTIRGTTGHGVKIVHDNALASNVTVSNSTIRNTTGGAGIDLDVSNATGTDIGASRTTITGNTIDSTGLQGINLDVGDNAVLANITVNNNSVVAGDTEAVLLTVTGNNAKTVNFEANDNHLSNSSTNSAFSIQANGAVTLNATVHDNVLANASGTTGRAFEAATTDGNAAIQLSLLDNSGSVGAGNTDLPFLLNKTAGSFGVVLLTTTDPISPPVAGEPEKIPDANMRNGGEWDPVTGTVTKWVIDYQPGIGSFNNLPEGSVPTP